MNTENIRPLEILKLMDQPIKRVGTSFLYKLGLLFVTFAMILLPLIYLGIIGCAGYGIYYHAANNWTMITSIDSSTLSKFYLGLLYISPIIIGAILIFFMLKPFFAKGSRQFQSVPLTEEDEPFLFDFVEKICEAVHAPVPKCIQVDFEVNAYAALQPGLLSFLKRDMILNIGLPLVAGLTIRELAGVLAHEFGHFSQGGAMRMSYIIRTINSWFARVVYEKDEWDESLVDWSHTIDIRIGFIFYIARMLIWLTRKILWLLMQIGHIISCFMLRQMEYNADLYEIRLCGSDTFSSTSQKMAQLNLAFQLVQQDLAESWKEKRLGDNLPQMIANEVQRLPAEYLEKIRECQANSHTGIFDTHPSDQARTKFAQKQNEEGIFQLEIPAGILFKKFEETAKFSSLIYYNLSLPAGVEKRQLKPLDEVEQHKESNKQALGAMSRYFQNLYSYLRPFTVDNIHIKPPEDFSAIAQKLSETRKEFRQKIQTARQSADSFEEAYGEMVQANGGLSMLQAGFILAHGALGLPFTEKKLIQSMLKLSISKQSKINETLEPLTETLRLRIHCAFQLLYNEKIKKSLQDDYVSPEKIDEKLMTLNTLGQAVPTVESIRKNYLEISVLLQNYETHLDENQLQLTLRRRCNDIRRILDRLRSTLQYLEYPFDHTDGKISISTYVVSELATCQGSDLIYKAQESIDNFYTLYFRLLGEIVAVAEKIETVVGLKPLKEPKPSVESLTDEEPVTA